MNTHVPNENTDIQGNQGQNVQVPVCTNTVVPAKKQSRKRFSAEEVVALCEAYCFATN